MPDDGHVVVGVEETAAIRSDQVGALAAHEMQRLVVAERLRAERAVAGPSQVGIAARAPAGRCATCVRRDLLGEPWEPGRLDRVQQTDRAVALVENFDSVVAHVLRQITAVIASRAAIRSASKAASSGSSGVF